LINGPQALTYTSFRIAVSQSSSLRKLDMTIWNFLRSVADSLLGSSSSSAPSKAQKKKQKKKSQSPKTGSKERVARKSSPPSEPMTTSVRAKDRSPQAKSVPKSAPPPSQPATEQAVVPGACTPFTAAVVDSAGIRCRCTPEIPDIDDADLFIDLGIDFGTRYTKVCFRDSDNNRTRIVTFDQGMANLGQALVPSQLALLEGGAILTGLTAQEWENSQWPVTKTLEFIKMRLAALDVPQDETTWLPAVKELDGTETIENLSAYFLSRLIARSRNWIQTTYPDLFKERSVAWVLKVGAPVEYWRGPAIDRFEYVLKLAWALSFTPLVRGADMVTLPQLSQCMGRVREWVKQNPEMDCSAKPEIAGAVWSHIRAAGSKEGFFVFFDVGEGTTEGASFRFYRDSGENKIAFYSGFVRPLGVAALTHQLSQELDISFKAAREKMLTWKGATHSRNDTSLHGSKTRRQLQRLVGTVVFRGCNLYQKIRPHMWEEEIGPKLGIFMGGGGGQIPFYRDAIVSTHADFNHQSADINPYDLRPMPVPKDLSMRNLGAGVFNRFAIAYGLSIADGEFPEFEFPSEEDAPSPRHNHSDPMDYDDTKDAC